MCGIVAIVAQEEPLPAGTLEQATRRLRHRGPDGVQFWHSDNHRVGLGHARLSVIDLATGAQPIPNENGTLRIVVNGEFYDFERIRCELVARQHRLRTRSDSEIALHLFEEDGVNCLRQLRGEFALAIWDESNGTLFAARDRFGIKPLFFAEVHGTLFVASEVKALAAAGVRLSWDYDSVAQNLFSSLVGSRTLYQGVYQVPPGHYLVAKNGTIRLSPYWDLNYPRFEDSAASSSDGEWIEQLRYHVREAVRLRMRSDVPVGCLLSGGLDSSAALGIARTFNPGALKAFTIAFDHPDYDESAVAGASAAQFDADFHPIRVTNKDFAAVFPDVVWQMEGFCFNVHAPARFLLSSAVRNAGVKVVLAGEGADELTAGYRFCRDALAEPDLAWSWPKVLIHGLARKNSSPGQIAALAPGLREASMSLNYPRFFFEHRSGQMAAEQGLLNSSFLQKHSAGDPYFTFFRQIDVTGQLEGRERVRQSLYLWTKSSFANYILSGERLDMAHGIEQRLPFLDHVLFEFARNIPSKLLLRDGQEKWILREAMKPFVTEQVYRGRKRPFVGPPSFLQDGSEMLVLAQDRLRSQTMASVPFFDHRAVVAFLNRLGSIGERERSAFDPLILLLLSCSVLQERYRLGTVSG